MSESSKTTVSGIFRSKEDLAEAINYLERKEVSEKDISVLMSEETKNHQFAVNTITKAPEEALKGLATGGLLGAVIGGLTVIGTVVIPGIGLVVGGPIIGIMAGAAAGGILGSVIGTLVGLGIPEYEAKFYENALKEKGNILLVAHINKDIKPEVKKLFNKYGATHIATK